MPQIAAFPKAYMQELCRTGKISLRQWIELAASLDIDGLELYCGMLDLQDPATWNATRRMIEDHDLAMPMLCCSPDFTHPDAAFREEQIEQEERWIDMTAALGGQYCRVLSGQRRPELNREQGIALAADCIRACLPHAAERGVTLILENHYKDDFWTYPEFAQHADVFCALVDRLDPETCPNFGVNFDPSNTLLAGEDPLELLRRVRERVVTMHASDRYLAEGTIDDLRREENVEGYAARLRHGEVGKGLNDYDAIFEELKAAGFDGWISIEDGIEGMDQLERSVRFLREKLEKFWPDNS